MPRAKGSLKNNLAVSPETDSGRGSDQLLNSQFPILIRSGCRTGNWPLLSDENWELRIGQMLPILHFAKLFLSVP